MSIKEVMVSLNKDMKNSTGKKSKKSVAVVVVVVAGVSAVVGAVLYLQKKSKCVTMDKIKDCTSSIKSKFNNAVENVKGHMDEDEVDVLEDDIMEEVNVADQVEDMEINFSDEVQTIQDETEKE